MKRTLKFITLGIFCLIWIIPCLMPSLTYCQDTTLRLRSLKFYTNVPLAWEEKFEPSYSYGYVGGRAFYFSPAVTINTLKGNFHEIEFADLFYDQKIIGIDFYDTLGNIFVDYDAVRFKMGFRYEYNYMLFKQKNWKRVNPYLGISANPYFMVKHYRPVGISRITNYNIETYEEYKVAVNFCITPRLLFHLGKQIYADLNFPLCFMSVDILHQESQITHSRFYWYNYQRSRLGKLFNIEQSMVRLGIGLKL